MKTMIAWSESVAAGTVLIDIQPVDDQVIQQQNNHFVMPTTMQLFWAWIGSADLNRARFVTPTWRAITNPEIRPVDTSVQPTDLPSIFDHMRDPLAIKGTEQLQLDAFHDNVGAQIINGIASIGDRITPAPTGDLYTLRGTSVGVAVINAWTAIPIVWDDDLPEANWAIVGLEHRSATAIAARVRLQGQKERPGTLSVTAIGIQGWPKFLDGQVGEFGRFRPTFMPEIEVFCTGADAVHTVTLSVIRVG